VLKNFLGRDHDGIGHIRQDDLVATVVTIDKSLHRPSTAPDVLRIFEHLDFNILDNEEHSKSR